MTFLELGTCMAAGHVAQARAIGWHEATRVMSSRAQRYRDGGPWIAVLQLEHARSACGWLTLAARGGDDDV